MFVSEKSLIIFVSGTCEEFKVDIYKGIEVFFCYNKVRDLLYSFGHCV